MKKKFINFLLKIVSKFNRKEAFSFINTIFVSEQNPKINLVDYLEQMHVSNKLGKDIDTWGNPYYFFTSGGTVLFRKSGTGISINKLKDSITDEWIVTLPLEVPLSVFQIILQGIDKNLLNYHESVTPKPAPRKLEEYLNVHYWLEKHNLLWKQNDPEGKPYYTCRHSFTGITPYCYFQIVGVRLMIKKLEDVENPAWTIYLPLIITVDDFKVIMKILGLQKLIETPRK